MPEDLSLATGSLGLQLEALPQGREVVGHALGAEAACPGQGVVVAEYCPQLTGPLGHVLIAEAQGGVEVLVEQGGVTATVGLPCLGLPYQEVPLVTGTPAVQGVALPVRGPEGLPVLTEATGHTDRPWAGLGEALTGHKVLVGRTGASRVGGVTPSCFRPQKW